MDNYVILWLPIRIYRLIFKPMKRLILFSCLILLPSYIIGQLKPITPPLGLTFGMSEDSFKSIMKKYGEFDQSYNQPYGKALSYINVKIGNTTSDIVGAKFVNNKLFEVTLYYLVEDIDIHLKYREFCNIFEDKYGTGKEIRYFISPYQEKDGHFVEAVKNGKAKIFTLWESVNTITVTIDKLPAIEINYQSVSLYDEARKKGNRNLNEF